MTEPGSQDGMVIDVSLVRRLLEEQFPQHAELPIRPVEVQGHDNRTFRLGETMSVRLPSGRRYADQVAIEQAWLGRLAPELPLPIPVPLGSGRPARGYPWRWTINPWLAGRSAASGRVADPIAFARHLAGFLNALRRIDATNGPVPGEHNFFRGGDLHVYDRQSRRCIGALAGIVDVRVATAIWEAALGAAWTGSGVWVHGDVAAGNLLVHGGVLSAVIDFGQLAVGDPACDTTVAWTLFRGASRAAFRDALDVDEPTWVRGRGWALWKALLEVRARAGRPTADGAWRVLTEIMTDAGAAQRVPRP